MLHHCMTLKAVFSSANKTCWSQIPNWGGALTLSSEILYWLADLLMDSVMWLMRWHFAVAPLWQHFPLRRSRTATVVYHCSSLAEWSHHTAVARRAAARRASSWPLKHSLYTSQITFILGSSGWHGEGGDDDSHLLPWHSYKLSHLWGQRNLARLFF